MATTPINGWPVPSDTDFVINGAAAIRDFADAVDEEALVNNGDQTITAGSLTIDSAGTTARTLDVIREVSAANTTARLVVATHGNGSAMLQRIRGTDDEVGLRMDQNGTLDLVKGSTVRRIWPWNVVQTVKTDTFVLSASTATPFTDVTGMTVTITPTSATSKVLVMVQSNGSVDAPAIARINGGNAGNYIGDAEGSRLRPAVQIAGGAGSVSQVFSIAVVDSPATTSAVTYALQVRSGGQTAANVHINRSASDENNANRMRTASSIIAIEVAA